MINAIMSGESTCYLYRSNVKLTKELPVNNYKQILLYDYQNQLQIDKN
jgi:hypothetical protein